MLQIILKSAWRQLWNNKGYSAINILGLSVGLSAAILCGLWIQQQWSYNRFHENKEQLFQGVQDFRPSEAEMATYHALPLPMAKILQEETPGVKYVAEADWGMTLSLSVGEQKLLKDGNYVGQDFLRMFTFPLLQGDPETALSAPNQIVINTSTARALFGEKDPMGKTVNIGEDALQVSGVMEDIPANSTLQYDFLLPFSLKVQQYEWMNAEYDNWESYSYQLFFQLEPKASIEQIIAQHRNTIKSHDPASISTFNAHALTDWHLYNTFEEGVATTGRIRSVRLFGIIGLLVLFIACVNFINLSTARAEKRSKEIGVRKAIGAQRSGLIAQFFGEAGVTMLIAFSVACLLVVLVLPYFCLLVEEQIAFPWDQLSFWVATTTLLLLSTLFAGVYPAFFLTRYSAKDALQKSFQTRNSAHNWSRRALVVTQFVVAIALIAGSLVVYQQVQYGQEIDAGYEREGLLDIPLTSALRSKLSTVEESLLATQGVTSLCTSSSPMTELFSTTNSINWPGRMDGDNLEVGIVGVGGDFFTTVGLDFLEGRAFKQQADQDTAAIIINETAVRQMQLDDPLATTLKWDDDAYVIIGVVEDAIMDSPFDPVLPTAYLKRNWRHSLLVRLQEDTPVETSLATIKIIIEELDPTTPFNYTFVEESYAEKFKSTSFLGTIALVFAGLAIFLSTLGLLGLVVYVVERRAREISIRKILGASIGQLWGLLSQEFIWMILAGGLIAVPLGGYFLEEWLGNFTYRIDLPWMMFGLAAGIALLIALATISFQSLKAALVNPAKRLRDNG